MIDGGSLPYIPPNKESSADASPGDKIGTGALIGGTVAFASAAAQGAAVGAVLTVAGVGAVTLGGVVAVGVGACFVVKSVSGLFR